MPILRLIAQMSMDKTGFDAALVAADKSVSRFGKGLKSQLAAAFTATAVTAFLKNIIDLGSEVKTLSDRLGVSVEDVQEFGLAAKISGGDFETFAHALEKLRVASVKAASGEGNPLEVFGFTVNELKKNDAPAILKELSDALQDFNGSAEQTKALREVFGRGAGGVVAMLQNLPDVAGAARLTKQEAELLDQAGDRLTMLWNKLLVLGAKVFVVPETGLQKGMPAKKQRIGLPPEIDVGAADRAEAHMATQDRILRIEKELEEVTRRNEFSQLSKEETLNRLAEEREQIFARIATTEEQRSQKALDLAKNEADIISATEKKTQRDRVHIESSSLGRIGAFTGASAQATLSANQAAMVSTLNQIRDALVIRGIIIQDVK